MKEAPCAQISCNAHDHIEIVCMRASTILVTLHSGEQYQGIARDITRINGAECLQVESAQGGLNIELVRIKLLQARDNPVEAHNFTVQLGVD